MIDLSRLTAPKAIERLSFEEIRAQAIEQLKNILPEWDTCNLESDPAVKILEVFAYREMLLRQRINDALKAVLLPYAVASDLDNLAAFYGISRLQGESDDDFRRRILLSLSRFSAAGSTKSYAYWAYTADPRVKDVCCVSPAPGEVSIYVLSNEGDGTPSAEILTNVETTLTAKDVRPLTDHVQVFPATVKHFSVRAGLYLYPEAIDDVVLAEAQKSLNAVATELHKLAKDFSRTKIISALHVAGVERVNLYEPGEDIVCGPGEAPFIEQIKLLVEGKNE